MISDYDKKYNRLSKLYKSKWTSLKKINGWKHYEVANIDKKIKIYWEEVGIQKLILIMSLA